MTEKDLIGKTIESVEVNGYGIEMRFTDGAVFVYYASDGGYSSWEIEKDDNALTLGR
jgi:hypothetical protein